ncbi:MAG: hypothetical protein WED00_18425 [Aquisalimonadaceae bacterium]
MRETEIDQDLPKTPWRQEIRLTRESGEVLTAVSESLLNGGLAVLLNRAVRTGEQLILDAVLPNHAAHRLEPVRMHCRVAYLVALTHPPDTLRAGLTILQIDPSHKQRLLRFARERIQRQQHPADLRRSGSS